VIRAGQWLAPALGEGAAIKPDKPSSAADLERDESDRSRPARSDIQISSWENRSVACNSASAVNSVIRMSSVIAPTRP